MKQTARLMGIDEVDAGAKAGANMAGGQEAVADVPDQAAEEQEMIADVLVGMAEAPLGAGDIGEGASLAGDVGGEAEQTIEDVEGDDQEERFEEGHLVFRTSQVFDHDFHRFRKRGFILDSSRCRAGGSSTTLNPRENEVVIF